MSFSKHVDDDLAKGITLEDCLRRFAGYLDAWVAGQSQWRQQIEARLRRLEGTLNLDKQTIDEVDTSVRQSWESLRSEIEELRAKVNQLDSRTVGSVRCR
jgi:uncharacterized coiled-coil protein SlyX